MGFAQRFDERTKKSRASAEQPGFVQRFERRLKYGTQELTPTAQATADKYAKIFEGYDWKSGLTYDEWDEEDQQRAAAGKLPKAVENAYDFDDPIDVYLYNNGMPPKKSISSYAKKAQEQQETDAFAARRSGLTLQNLMLGAAALPQAAKEQLAAGIGPVQTVKKTQTAAHTAKAEAREPQPLPMVEPYKGQGTGSLSVDTVSGAAATPRKALEAMAADPATADRGKTGVYQTVTNPLTGETGQIELTPRQVLNLVQEGEREAQRQQERRLTWQNAQEDFEAEYAEKYGSLSENLDWADRVRKGAAMPLDRELMKSNPSAIERDPYQTSYQDIADEYAGIHKYWDYFTQDERNVYNYLRAEDPEAAQEYYGFMLDRLKTRWTREEVQRAEDYAVEDPFAANLYSVVSSIPSAIKAAPYTAGQFFKGEAINPEDPAYALSLSKSAIRQKTAEGIDSDALKFLYEAGMSTADFVALMPFGSAVSLSVMGANSFADTARDAAARGATTDEAVALGAVAGLAEVLTEKAGIDRLFEQIGAKSGKTVRKMLWEVAKSALSEGGEEVVTEVVDTIADLLIMGDKAQLNARRQAAMEAGASYGDATWQVFKEWLTGDLLMSFLGGAVGGLMMSGPAVTVNKLANDIKLGREIKASGGVQDTLDFGRELGVLSPVQYENAQKKTPSTRKLGSIATETREAAVRAITGEDQRAALELSLKAEKEEIDEQLRQTLSELPTPESVDTAEELQKRSDWTARKLKTVQENGAAYDQAARVAQRLGAKFQLADLGPASGQYENGTITINPYQNDPVRQVLVHELTHHLETSGEYQELQKMALELFSTQSGVSPEQLRQNIIKKYAGYGVTLDESGADRELTATFCENRLFQDEKSIETLSAKNPNLFQRVWQWIKDTVRKLRGTGEEKKLLELEQLYRRAARTTGQTEGYAGTQYSFAEQRIPTYEELIQKEPVAVVDIREEAEGSRAQQRKAFLGSEEAAQITREPVVNRDTGEPVFITAQTFTHSFSNRGAGQISAAKKIREIIENAVLTHGEAADHGNPNATGVYTLFGAVRTENGVQPVKIKVKEYAITKDRLPAEIETYFKENGVQNPYASAYDSRVLELESIELGETEKESYPVQRRQDIEDLKSRPQGHPSSSPVITVADLMGLVNGDYQKYLPQRENSAQNSFSLRIEDFQTDSSGSLESGIGAEQTGPIEELERSADPELSERAKTFKKRYQRQFTEKMAEVFHLNPQAKRELGPIIDQIATETMKTGQMSEETKEMLFDEMISRGMMHNLTFYNEYEEAADFLRGKKFSTEGIESDTRKALFGKIPYSKEGEKVDIAYQELSGLWPGLFPEDITNPNDQLNKIAEVKEALKGTWESIEQYYGEDTDTFRRNAWYAMESELYDLRRNMGLIERYETAKWNAAQEKRILGETAEDYKAVEQAMRQRSMLKKEVERARASELLTDRDRLDIDYMAKDGEVDLRDRGNRDAILRAVEAQKAYEENEAILKAASGKRIEARKANFRPLLINSDRWKNRKNASMFFETPWRVFEDVAGPDGPALAQAIMVPMWRSVQARNEWMRGWGEKIAALNLTKEESALVQLMGENRIPAEELREGITYEDGSPVDIEKISNAVKTFREFYDEALDMANRALLRNNYEPIGKREHYFPHIGEEMTDWESFVEELKKGMEAALPTEIAGMTEYFTPGKKWFANFQQRKGNATANDAVRGFNQYIKGVADVIYLTDSIQDLRTLNGMIREKYGMPKQEESELSGEEHAKHLSSFVVWLNEYANILAGKTSGLDRVLERFFNRSWIKTADRAKKLFGANAVAGNLSTAVSNFIPLTQGIATMPERDFLYGMQSAIRNEIRSWFGKNDGLWEKSSFLSRRFGTFEDVQTSEWKKFQGKMEKTGGFLFELIDRTVAETLVRGKYHENLRKGMDAESAMLTADEYAMKTMADRSTGQMPVAFNSKTLGIITQFQLEVKNQLSNITKDIPRWNDKKFVKTLVAYLKMFAASWLLNEVFEKITGRRAAPDLIDAGWDLVEDLQETDEEGNPQIGTALLNFGEDILEMLPFASMLTGGRVPLVSSLEKLNPATALKKTLDGDEGAGKAWTDIIIALGNFIPFTKVLPMGGAQIKKTAQGLYTVAQGGSYSGKDDDKKLRFYSDQSAGDYAKAALFGQYALPEAQEYVENGFRSLSVGETRAFDAARETGVEPEKAMEVIEAFREIKPDKDEKGKTVVTSTSKKRKLLLEDKNLTQKQKKAIDRELLAGERGVADYSSAAMLELWEISEDTYKKAKKAKLEGIDPELYLKLYKKHKEIKNKDASAREKATEFDRYLVELGLDEYTRILAEDYLGFYTQVRAQPEGLPDAEIEGLPNFS